MDASFGYAPQEQSSLDYCLRPMLQALGWEVDESVLFESMPHLMSIDNLEKFSWVMTNLGYTPKTYSVRLSEISEKALPSLFVPSDGTEPFVILSKKNDKLQIFDSVTKKEVVISDLNKVGVGVSFKKTREELVQKNHQHWFKEVLYDCKGMIFFLVFIGIFQAILFITPPAYIMFLYDKVINTSSYTMLITFSIGIILAMTALVILMNIRSRVLGYFGSRLQKRIGNLIFMRMLKLHPQYIESSPLSRLMTRINEFNQLREFFGGPLFSAMVDLPFVIIFLAFIWIIAGPMVIVPIVAMVAYYAVARIIWFFTKRTINENAHVRGKYQNYLLETFGGMRSLHFSGFQKVWLSNFKEMSALSSVSGKNTLLLNSFSEAIFDAMNFFTGIATLVTGAILVINGTINMGALIAVLFVIWRLLAPVKIVATMYPQLVQVAQSTKQIGHLMSFPAELPTAQQWENSPRRIDGDIRFEQVSFRYPNFETVALKNISFSIKKGETVLIVGPTGSGKSTIINLILNIYSVYGGSIYIDGVNIKQFDVNVLRKIVSVVPQKTELFYGTIAQNLKLAKPLATQEELLSALRSANLDETISKLPAGLDTRIRFYGDNRFGASFLQKMSLARAYLRSGPILLLDEPISSLDEQNVQIFSDYIKKIKGNQTTIICGHSTQFSNIADKVIVLFDGFIVGSGKPEEVLKNIPKGII